MVFMVGTCNWWFLAGNLVLVLKSVEHKTFNFYLPKILLLLRTYYEVFEIICFMHLSMFVFFCFTNIETCFCDKDFEFEILW